MEFNEQHHHGHHGHDDHHHKSPYEFVVAGHHISRRDAILASVAVGLLLFGLLLGALGLFNGPAHKNSAADTSKQVVDQADLLNQQWSYMPGAFRDKDGLHIIPDGFVITTPTGVTQPNPPINLYGTYLEEVKDIAITATLTPGKGTLSLRFYSEPPIVADTFRDERKSIDLGITGNVLSISTWDRATPTTSTYTFDGSGKMTLSLTRQNRVLSFAVNGKQIATLPEGNIFSTSKLWFGTDAAGDSWTLHSLHADALNNTRVTVVDASKFTAKQATDGFQALANIKRNNLTIGVSAALGPMVADSDYRNIAIGQFGQLTPSDALKWQTVHPAANDYDFAQADALLDLATRNGLNMHGSPLIASDSNAPWVMALPVATDTDKKALETTMTSHITEVIKHYKDKVQTWDVVHEPFDDATGYRDNKWFQAMGKDYIAKAFAAADKADPGAKLYINERGLEQDGPRWDAFLAMVTELKHAGVPIDGVGFEAHVTNAATKIDAAVLRKHIQQLKALDMSARISDMSVYADDGAQPQSDQYSGVLGACLQEDTCVAFTVAGVGNKYDYYKDASNITQQGGSLLYDINLKPTTSADNLRDLLTR